MSWKAIAARPAGAGGCLSCLSWLPLQVSASRELMGMEKPRQPGEGLPVSFGHSCDQKFKSCGCDLELVKWVAELQAPWLWAGGAAEGSTCPSLVHFNNNQFLLANI